MTGSEALLPGTCAADDDVPVAGRRSRLLHRAVDAIGDERQRRSRILHYAVGDIVRRHEHRHLEGRVGDPAVLLVPEIERPPSHHDRAGGFEHRVDDIDTTTGLAAAHPRVEPVKHVVRPAMKPSNDIAMSNTTRPMHTISRRIEAVSADRETRERLETHRRM